MRSPLSFSWGIIKRLQKASEAAENIKSALTDAWENIKSAWETAKTFFGDLWSTIKEKGGEAADKVKDAFGKAVDGIKSAWDGVKSFFDGVWSGIKDVFGNAWNEFKSIGGNILEGLWNGISDKIGWLKSKVTGIVDTIKGWFTGKDGFDEHSPSKWSNKVFRYLMEGGVNGLDEGSARLMREVNEITGRIKESMNFGTQSIGLVTNGSGYSAARTGQGRQHGNLSGGNTFNFTFNSPKALDPVSAHRESRKAAQILALGYM